MFRGPVIPDARRHPLSAISDTSLATAEPRRPTAAQVGKLIALTIWRARLDAAAQAASVAGSGLARGPASLWFWTSRSDHDHRVRGPQRAPQMLAITHIFPRRINALPAALKEVPFCAEPFGGHPPRATFQAQT